MGNICMSPTLDTIPKRIQFLVEKYPDRELFIFYQGGTRDPYTPKRLFQLAGKFAYRLRQKYGFQRNDVIANTLPNSPERLITDLGIILAGCTGMNGQIMLADGSDFFESFKNSRCAGLVLQSEDDVAAWQFLKPYVTGGSSSIVTELACVHAPDLTTAILVSRKPDELKKPLLEDLEDSNDEVFVESTIGTDDLLYIFTTSGSTGCPKLVHRTHKEFILMSAPLQLVKDNAINEESVLYSDRLLGWTVGSSFYTYCIGMKLVLLDKFEHRKEKCVKEMWDAFNREKCNICCLIPLELENLLKYKASNGTTSAKIRTLATGAQPLNKAHLARMLSIAEQVHVVYGTTETGTICSGFARSEDVDDYFCGKPVGGVQVKVVNENGESCPPRKTGNIIAEAVTTFKGYFNCVENPDPNTAKCFTKEGWFDTGDTGYLDEYGNLYVLGRKKDVILFGTYLLYPAWLEAEIIKHPDVSEIYILPVSDPVLFQNICACVLKVSGSDLSEEKLKEYWKSIFFAEDNPVIPIPKFFMILDSFPETATGKPNKKQLRILAEEMFGTTRVTNN